MKEFLMDIYSEFTGVYENVHLEYNLQKTPRFPYVVYKYTSERVDRNSEGFYIDLDIYGNSNNTLEIEEIAHDFKRKLDGKRVLSCGHLLQFQFRNSAMIATEHTNIRRRWVEVYIKTSWRDA